MNIDYFFWPIWCDYLEENGQNTELLRYVLTYSVFPVYLGIINAFGNHYNPKGNPIDSGYNMMNDSTGEPFGHKECHNYPFFAGGCTYWSGEGFRLYYS